MIYRLPNRLVTVAQASCPPRDRFAVANLFSAKGALSSLANPGASPQAGNEAAPLARHISKAMRGRIALQSTSCEMGERTLLGFAQALGVRMRPRIALTLRPTNMRVLIFVFLMLVPFSLFG